MNFPFCLGYVQWEEDEIYLDFLKGGPGPLLGFHLGSISKNHTIWQQNVILFLNNLIKANATTRMRIKFHEPEKQWHYIPKSYMYWVLTDNYPCVFLILGKALEGYGMEARSRKLRLLNYINVLQIKSVSNHSDYDHTSSGLPNNLLRRTETVLYMYFLSDYSIHTCTLYIHLSVHSDKKGTEASSLHGHGGPS